MNTQELNNKAMAVATENKQDKDQFAQSLMLWMASFPLFVVGLVLSGGSLHAVSMLFQLAAAICFLSPVTLLLGCFTDSFRF